MTLRLEGNIAVVTGAGGGIGRAIAQRLAEEGATVVLGDIDAAGLDKTASIIRDAGGTAHGLVGDATDEADANALIQAAMDIKGTIDILINNVGGGGQGRLWDMSPDDWDAAMRLNLRGTFLCTRAAVPHMIERKSGKIICISSGAKDATPWLSSLRGATAYSTAKAGLIGFVRDTALQFGEHGVRVNALAVGAVATDKAAPYFEHINKTYQYSPDNLTWLRRVGVPVEIANAALFLASEESSYVTGATLYVNGGR